MNTPYGIELSGSVCEFDTVDQDVREYLEVHHENHLVRSLHPLCEFGVEVTGEAVIPELFTDSVFLPDTNSSQHTTTPRSRSKLFFFFHK